MGKNVRNTFAGPPKDRRNRLEVAVKMTEILTKSPLLISSILPFTLTWTNMFLHVHTQTHTNTHTHTHNYILIIFKFENNIHIFSDYLTAGAFWVLILFKWPKLL